MGKAAITAILALLCREAFGGTTAVGDWMVEIEPGYQEAFTRNASGSQTGVFCLLSAQTCFAYIQTTVECEQGGSTPILINSVIGAAVSNTTCVKVPMANSQTLRFNKVEDFATYRRTVQGGGESAFATPLASGQFTVSRFSGRGATEAVTAAMALPSTAPAPTSAPHDQVL